MVCYFFKGISFRELDFKINTTTEKIEVIKSDPGDSDDQVHEIYRYGYHMFQPIKLGFIETKDSGKFRSDSTPAFFFMGIENAEQLKARNAALGLSLDVALTFSGIGNLAHLNKLSRGYKIVKGTIAGLDIATSTVDMIINYSSACDGNKEFCKKIQDYNFWFQMAAFSSDVLVHRLVKRSAREALESSTGGIKKELREHLEEVATLTGKRNGLYNSLTSVLRKTHDDLISNGLKAIEDSNGIKFYDKLDNEIASIVNNKFVVKKWKGTYRADEITKTESGFWLVKKDNDYGIDLGFNTKNQRSFTADEVNNYHTSIGNHAPYQQGWPVNERVLGQGEKIYIVEYKNGGNPSPGGWGSKNKITDVKELREKLAVLQNWKDEAIDNLVIREYTVKQGKELKVRDGVVAALQETSGVNKGKVFQGGEHQFEFIDNIRGDNWKDFLTISSKKGITLKLANAGNNIPTRLIEGKNIFRASSQEYSLAKKSFKEYRQGVIYEQSKILSGDDLTLFKNEFNRKNIAKVEGKIDDIPLDNSFRRSGDEFDGEPIFDSYKVDSQGNIDVDGAWSREWDTEYVMLSEIAKSKGAVKGAKYPKITGEIIISSELPYCVSCQGVIQDFSDMFPNINVILIDGLR